MNILVTCDENYIPPFKTLLYTLFIHQQSQNINIHFIYKGIPEAEIGVLEEFIHQISNGQGTLFTYDMSDYNMNFENAVRTRYYTEEMYYYLLAYAILPEDVKRVIYLDPDTVVLNSLEDLYTMDLEDHLYAGAEHALLPSREANAIRLRPFTKEMPHYINAGVLLMDLEKQRDELEPAEIFDFLNQANPTLLLLPDQDVLNVLYGKRIKPLDERLYNYDSRYFLLYYADDNTWTRDHIMNHTVVIHFCGGEKPWEKNATGKFVTLYRYFQSRMRQIDNRVRSAL